MKIFIKLNIMIWVAFDCGNKHFHSIINRFEAILFEVDLMMIPQVFIFIKSSGKLK